MVERANERLPKVLADWNRRDDTGRVILSAKRGPQHNRYDYGRLEAQRVLLVDPPEAVEAIIERDEHGRWVGAADWRTRSELDPAETAAVAKYGIDYDERPFPGIWINPALAAGVACLDGTELSAKRILTRLSTGLSVQAVANVHGLQAEQVRTAIAYAAWLIGGQDPEELAQWQARAEPETS